MARKRRTFDKEACPDVWELTEHPSGYIQNRNGIATVRYGNSFRRSLKMEFVPKNRKRAVALGNHLVTEYKRKRAGLPSALSTSGSAVAPRPKATVRSAWAQFKEAKLEGRGRGTLLRYRQSFIAFYPERTDLPMDYDQLHSYFASRLKVLRSKYANNNLAKLAGCQVQFMNYCRDRKLIDGNPFSIINLPKTKKKDRVITYTVEQTRRVVKWYRENAANEERLIDPRNRTSDQHANLILFLYASACRIQETISLKDERYVADRTTENYFTADRVILNQTKNGEQRTLPIDLLPGLREAIELQRPYIEQNGGYLFPWRDTHAPVRAFKKCVAALSADPNDPITIEMGPRPLHAFRATAEGVWKRLNWSKDVITWLAGHSEETYERDYESEFTFEEIVERIPGFQSPPKSTPSNVIPYHTPFSSGHNLATISWTDMDRYGQLAPTADDPQTLAKPQKTRKSATK